MIVKNEEKTLERCLKSVDGIFDEIIIVDTGSTDLTKDIAKKHTKKVFDFVWQDDFALARNFSFAKASKQYIMWLDADDVIDGQNKELLINFKNNATDETDVYMLKYNIVFDEMNNPTFTYYRERILKREKKFLWVDAVHEVIVPKGKIEYLNISINHQSEKNGYTNRNLKIYEKLIKQGIKFSARQQFYYARELMQNNKIKKAIKQFNIFLKNKEGWIENKISASLDLHSCYIKINEKNKALESLLYSFQFNKPRAEICFNIGCWFEKDGKMDVAIYWFEQAIQCEMNVEIGGFWQKDYYGYYPHLEMCVCYFKLGNIEKAKYHNEMAGKIKPKSKEFLQNKEFFERLETI